MPKGKTPKGTVWATETQTAPEEVFGTADEVLLVGRDEVVSWGANTNSIPIPAGVGSLSGLTAYSQGFTLDPSLPASDFGVSNGQIHRF